MLTRLIEKLEDGDTGSAISEANDLMLVCKGKNNVIVPAEQMEFVLGYLVVVLKKMQEGVV